MKLKMTLPTIVFVHGAGGGAWEWEFWQAIFEARGWDTLAGDLMPVGSGIAETQVDDYVEQIISWLDTAQLQEPPFLIGVSMAGPLVLKAMETVEVSGVVLINSLPVQGVQGWPASRVQFPNKIPWAAKGLAGHSLEKMPDYDEAVASLVAESWRDESGAVLNILYEGLEVAYPQCPALVVAGREDEDIPYDLSVALAEFLEADLVLLQGVSHLGALLGHRAEDVAHLVAEWVETVVVDQNELGIV